jgi:putative transposase
MPQSLVQNYLHIVFSTKLRQPFIDKEISPELFSYLAAICKKLECSPIIVGGHRDHVHLLIMLSRKIALMKLIEELKSHSSKWIKTKGPQYQNFYWQRGYGAFSVHSKGLDIVKQYISNQEEHHSKKSFQGEYREFLKQYNVEYDEKYVWD